MNRNARLNALVELLQRRGSLSVEEAVTELGASAATVRRDLDHLAAQQLLHRTRGGALPNGVAFDLPLAYKADRSAPQKHAIARLAASLVAPGDVVGLNGGTTTADVARALAARADLQAGTTDVRAGEPVVTLVTNALNIAHELALRTHLAIVAVGGTVRSQSYETTGPLADRVLEVIALDTAFVGVDAFDVSMGACAHHDREAATNRLMAARAQRVVVVADATKLGRRAFARICPVADVDVLVTDASAPAALLREFEQAGVEVLVAE